MSIIPSMIIATLRSKNTYIYIIYIHVYTTNIECKRNYKHSLSRKYVNNRLGIKIMSLLYQYLQNTSCKKINTITCFYSLLLESMHSKYMYYSWRKKFKRYKLGLTDEVLSCKALWIINLSINLQVYTFKNSLLF